MATSSLQKHLLTYGPVVRETLARTVFSHFAEDISWRHLMMNTPVSLFLLVQQFCPEWWNVSFPHLNIFDITTQRLQIPFHIYVLYNRQKKQKSDLIIDSCYLTFLKKKKKKN